MWLQLGAQQFRQVITTPDGSECTWNVPGDKKISFRVVLAHEVLAFDVEFIYGSKIFRDSILQS